MKDQIFGVLQRVGRSFMLPIAILPVAGLFLGIGGSFTNETMLETYGLVEFMGKGTIMYAILSVLNAAGSIVFANLPILFAMGVAIGMARKEKEVAALAAAIAFLIMHASIGCMIDINGGTDSMLAGSTTSVLGITSLQMGVFGGIIVGLGVSALHNRFYKIELPQVLSFFGGTRFVPIISSIVFLFVGIGMFFVWPPIQTGIYKVGDLVLRSGYGGTFIYGVMERALIPFGLHHVFYLPFWQTAVGGVATVNGQLIEGAQNIFFAELGTKGIEHFSVSATRFMSGKFPLMIFGLAGAALAMYKCAKPEKKKLVGGLLLSAALTSMLTGITEPIEFTFLFVAPILYVIHCALAGLSYMLMHILNVGVGMTFSGGLIDLTLFGILQGNQKTSWVWIVIVGIGYFIVYYFGFSFLINKFNFKTPGREEGDAETKLYTRADVNAKKGKKGENASGGSDDVTSAMITKGLGGKDNISDVDCCATRLRTTVFDASKVDESTLKQSGAAGVIKKGNGIQIIYGPRVTVIKSNLEDYLHSSASDIVEEETNVEATKVEAKVLAPLTGKVLTLQEVNDGVFSEGMLGEGIAIEPEDGLVVAPFDGEVSMVFDTKHAIGLVDENGVELLIHVGIDTVQLNGKYYEVMVKDGQKVKAGDEMLKVDLEGIKKEGYRTITPIIVTNTDNFQSITHTNQNQAKKLDEILDIK
ncbi:PTS transporter subunit IIABC [Anaerosacchariphilus polymeriproducens]|uniref:PTS glucose transporter subunit IIA n=1 Tax=Anaerosacchariphilus polymeriproducens TaxID=1812858 RepID=A0A371AR28_9FIRM|nr:PTS transporter subunit IIABC [Anaerosacchariphilus polymeriproducens]RDU21982.1 PTS glucose transporter subunit IIA [Anaerosacchariphilus polymeriproducens]